MATTSGTDASSQTVSGADRTAPEETPGDLKRQALQLLHQKRYPESEAAFLRLAEHPRHRAEALALAAVTQFHQQNLEAAEGHLHQALRTADAGTAADIHYQLGVIAERRGQPSRSFFQKALQLNPAHPMARSKLVLAPATARSGTTAESSSIPPPPLTVKEVAAAIDYRSEPGTRYGPYSSLTLEKNVVSQLTLNTIDALRMDASPRIIAHTGRMTGCLVAALLFTGLLLMGSPHSWRLGDYALEPALAQLLSSLFDLRPLLLLIVVWLGMWSYLSVRWQTVRLDQGRLQVRSGVLSRNMRNIELWRIHDVRIHQSLLNRITGDGSIHLHVAHSTQDNRLNLLNRPKKGEVIRLTGVFGGEDLEDRAQLLLNLIMYLRSQALIRGVVTY